MAQFNASYGMFSFNFNEKRMQNEPEDFKRVIHNHKVYIEAIENKDRNKMKEAFHLNFDDVDEQIDVLWNSQTNIDRK